MTDPTIELTRDQIDAYHRDGYLVIDRITTTDEIEWMRDVYDRLFAERAGRDVGDHFDLAGTDDEDAAPALPQILNPSKYAPELANSLYRANAAAIARQLLGDETVFRGDHAIMKPPSQGAATPWHQDEAYWDAAWDYTSLSFWMPLQPATVENGCMQFVPGSQRLEVLPHHSIHNDPRIHGLEVDDVPEADTSNAVACPLAAGGATIHNSRTLHYTSPNRTNTVRRAYILGFGLPGKPRETPRDFYWNKEKQTARLERAKQGGTTPPGV